MADHHYYANLLGAMDRLWFHQIILFSSEPISFLSPKTSKAPQPNSETPSDLHLLKEEVSSDSSPIPPKDHLDNTYDIQKPNYKRERPKRLSLIASKTRSHSSSPSAHKVKRLLKTMSCRRLQELEYEEVKGFVDLGFTFKKERLSPQMISVIPGLRRIGEYDNYEEDQVLRIEAAKESVMRPYLSEAWLIKRSNSPLLNLRMPPVSAAADMKKHLKFWARTVASEIQQES